MKLIGMLDSPFVRRVAISLKLLEIPFEHQALSVFRNVDEFSAINPLVKAPTLICDDGEMLIDSSLILDYIETLVGPEKSLMPSQADLRQHALRLIGIGLIACEKTVQIYYERSLRPVEKQHQPWLDRIRQQLGAAYDLLEQAAAQPSPWLFSDSLMQPDITVCVAWRFTQFMIPDVVDPAHYPALAQLSERAETLPEFVATPLE
ncbi:MAG TPA: glutathione S-transferase N-terminal domain-containing protein [Trichocoleus sp.]